jgi:hypothetical protein
LVRRTEIRWEELSPEGHETAMTTGVLLACGLKPGEIAKRYGVKVTEVERRVNALQEELRAQAASV